MDIDRINKENTEYFESQMELEKDIKELLKKHWDDEYLYQGHAFKLNGNDKFIKIWVKKRD